MKISPQIDISGAPVCLEVTFGYAAIGRYRVWLYDSNDKNPQLVTEGVSDDDIPDIVALHVPLEELAGRICFVSAAIASAVAQADMVSIKVDFTQDGVSVPDGTAFLKRSLDPMDEAVCSIAARFRVVDA